jgi:hypothetical protein
MAKHTVRLTLWPDRDIEVEGPELLDLQRQGLVLPPMPAPAAVEPPAGEPVPDSAPQRPRKPSTGGK